MSVTASAHFGREDRYDFLDPAARDNVVDVNMKVGKQAGYLVVVIAY